MKFKLILSIALLAACAGAAHAAAPAQSAAAAAEAAESHAARLTAFLRAEYLPAGRDSVA